jgi:uncharacterized glyoxalase superfamily protein PhnB
MLSTMTNKTVLWPTLSYRDTPAAIRFLAEAFGFTTTSVHADEKDPSIVHHAQLDWPGGGGVMLSSPPEERSGDLGDRPVGAGSIYIVTADPKAVYDRAVAAGATIAREMREEDYGSLGFTARDPEGVYWSFGTFAGE